MKPHILRKSGNFILTKHAQDRIRLRVGIDSKDVATAWVNEQLASSTNFFIEKNQVRYVTESFYIVCNGLIVITVKQNDNTNHYLTKFGALLAKEAKKLLDNYNRERRKAEITVAECTLNYLKAKNPKVKGAIGRKLTQATDEKARIEDEIKAVELAVERYGVEV